VTAPDARDRLIVALDVETIEAARALVATLGDAVSFYKIGMELAYGGGLELARELKDAGKRVFIDLKLHDIGATVERATWRALAPRSSPSTPIPRPCARPPAPPRAPG